ncbi:MAG: peptide chain release factor N(5)-glutamine methyltransferase [Clostridiales bacterium]|nr:peptide chain release factor N(5)-glutamine methyltransferase [Clostridiales bacterium]
MTLREAVCRTAKKLGEAVGEPALEARLMAAKLLGKDRLGFFDMERTFPSELEEELRRMAERRISGEPLQYILGEWWFMGLPFYTESCALIPRQDTETLCEEALRLIAERGYKTLLDICTGTGCIAVALAKLSGIETEASDISEECVRLAERNAERNGVRAVFRTADLFGGAGKYDLVTANPPYISEADMAKLQREVTFEPATALSGGGDGLDFYRRIAKEAAPHINRGGALLLEVGYGEAEKVRGLFPGRTTRTIKDLNGIERIVVVEF